MRMPLAATDPFKLRFVYIIPKSGRDVGLSFKATDHGRFGKGIPLLEWARHETIACEDPVVGNARNDCSAESGGVRL